MIRFVADFGISGTSSTFFFLNLLLFSLFLLFFFPHLNHKRSLPFLQIYLVNLRRRPDRRERMLFSLNELEIDVKVVDAVDGK